MKKGNIGCCKLIVLILSTGIFFVLERQSQVPDWAPYLYATCLPLLVMAIGRPWSRQKKLIVPPFSWLIPVGAVALYAVVVAAAGVPKGFPDDLSAAEVMRDALRLCRAVIVLLLLLDILLIGRQRKVELFYYFFYSGAIASLYVCSTAMDRTNTLDPMSLDRTNLVLRFFWVPLAAALLAGIVVYIGASFFLRKPAPRPAKRR